MFHPPDVKTNSMDRVLCRNICSANKLNKQLFLSKKSSVHVKRTAKQFKLNRRVGERQQADIFLLGSTEI